MSEEFSNAVDPWAPARPEESNAAITEDFSNAVNPFEGAVNPFEEMSDPAPRNAKEMINYTAKDLGGEESPDFNMIRGAIERSGQLLGGFFRSANEVAEQLDESAHLGGFVFDGGVLPSYYNPEQFKAWAEKANPQKPLDIAAKALKETDAGYVPEHTWEEVKRTFSEDGPLSGSAWGEVALYAAEQGVKSIPDMVAAAKLLPAYIIARSGEIGEERAHNKGKESPDLVDVLEAAPFALGSAILERIGVKGITDAGKEAFGKEALKHGFKHAAARVAKDGAKAGKKEALTEFLQEGIIEYTGERIGTQAGMDAFEAFDRGLAGAVAGGVYGGAAGGAGSSLREFSDKRSGDNEQQELKLDQLEQEVTDLHANVVDEFEPAEPAGALEDNSSDFTVSPEGEARRKQGEHKLADRVGRIIDGQREREASAHLQPAEINKSKAPYKGPRYEYIEDQDEQGQPVVSILDKEDGSISPISATEQGMSAQELNDRYLAQIKNQINRPSEPVTNHPPRTEPFAPPVASKPKPSAEEIEVAAADTNTAPSDAQIEADNYKKGRIKYGNLNIAIENPKGSVRSGVDEQGRKWESKMAHHYGDIKGTKGADGDDLDVFIGDSSESEKVFIIDQIDADTGKFDEHKVLVGFNSIEEAKAGYLANYEENWQGLGEITELHESELDSWIKEGDTTQPYRLNNQKPDSLNVDKPDRVENAETLDSTQAEANQEQQNPTETSSINPTDNNQVQTGSEAASLSQVSEPALTVSATGKPFVSEKAAKASLASKIRRGSLKGTKDDYEVSPTDGGFGYRLKQSEGGQGESKSESVQAVDDSNSGNANPNDGNDTASSVAVRHENATAPEHVQGVDDRELSKIVAEFNDAQADAISGVNGITNVFKAPEKSEIVRLNDKVKVYRDGHGWMSPAEAKKQIEQWKQHAKSQGKTDGVKNANAQKIVLSLFDLSGKWSQPWVDAGYQVFRFDLQDNPEIGDVNNFSVEFFNDYFGSFEGADIYAVLAACPCTDFASSGARHFAAKDVDGRTVASVDLVHQTLRTIEYFKPSVWAIENPVGRIEKLGGLPPWRLSFDPNHIGEDYTKKTLLWGRFNADLPIAPAEATEGSKMHRLYGGKSMATKNARSATPEGFAYSFFMANNAADHPVMAIHNKYDQLDKSVVEKAVKAGLTETEIATVVDDHYYFELDYKAANKALADLVEDRSQSDSAKSETQTDLSSENETQARRKNFGWDRVKLAKNYSAEELDAWIKELQADPENVNPDHANGKSLYMLDKKTRKKIDDLSWAIYHIRKSETGTEAESSPTESTNKQPKKKLSSVIDEVNEKNAGEELDPVPGVTIRPEDHVADATAKDLKAGPYPIDYHNAVNQALLAGELNLDDFQHAITTLVDNKEEILQRLNKYTKPVLMNMSNRVYWNNSDYKKPQVVEHVWDRLISSYLLDKAKEFQTETYNMSDLWNMTDEKRLQKKAAKEARKIEVARSNTESDLAKWAEGYKEEKAKREQEREAKEKALADPKTLPEFKQFIAAKGEGELSAEQLAVYDDLATKDKLEKLKERQAQQAEVQAVDGDVAFELHQTVHSKTDEDLYVVKLAGERLDKEKFNELRTKAKSLGGYYSSFRGKGAIPGFQFKSEEDRQRFVNVLSGENESSQSATEKKQAVKQDARVTKLLVMAERSEEKAQNVLNQDRKTNTARRASMAAGVEARAEGEVYFARLLREIAKATESGELNILSNLGTAAQLQELTYIQRRLIWDAEESLYKKDDLSRRSWKLDTTIDQKVASAKFPKPLIYASTLRHAAEGMAEVAGYKQTAKSILSRIKNLNSNDRVDLSRGSWESLLPKIKKFASLPGGMWSTKGKSDAGTIKEEVLSLSRLDALGITNSSMLRQALRELDQVEKNVSVSEFEKTKLEKMERELQQKVLANRKLFNDFFPTPEGVATEVVDWASITEGMKVLEPSAGNGLLADAVTREGGQVDAVELASDLREILEEKGYNVIGDDFLDLDLNPEYDRVVMNPPFSKDQDIKHVTHAFKALKPGGRLVAIVSSTAGDRQNNNNKMFREWVDELGAEEHALAANSFQSSLNPTGVNTKVFVIDKPEGSELPPPQLQKTQGESATVFSEGKRSAGGGISAKTVQRVVDRITSGWANTPDIKVAAKVSDLPQSILEEVKRRKPVNLNGVRSADGRVYLIAENIRGTAHAERVLAHEVVGHWAVEETQGADFKAIKGHVQKLKSQGDPVILKYAKRVNGEGNPDIESAEIIAKMAEDAVNHPIITRVLNWLRKILKRLKFKASFGVHDDLMPILKEAMEYVKQGDSTARDFENYGDLAFSAEGSGVKAERKGREAKFTLADDFFEWLNVEPGFVWGDVVRLQEKHTDMFVSADDVMQHLTTVLSDAAIAMPASKKEYTLLVATKPDSKLHRSAVVEFELKGGKYRVKNAQFMPEEQLKSKIAKAAREGEEVKTRGLKGRESLVPDEKSRSEISDRSSVLPSNSSQSTSQEVDNNTSNESIEENDQKADSSDAGSDGVLFSSDTPEGAGYGAVKDLTQAIRDELYKALNKKWIADLRPGWLALLTRRHLSDLAGKALPQIKQYVGLAQEMDARRNELLSKNADIAQRWTKFNIKNRAEAKRLAQLMHDATLAGVDPSKEYVPVMTQEQLQEIKAKNEKLIKDRSRDGAGGRNQGVRSADQLRQEIRDAEIMMGQEHNRAKAKNRIAGQWKALSPEAQAIFREVRDAYKEQRNETLKALEARIGRTVVDGKEAKALLDELREHFESVTVEEPYFPLARFGKYWVDVRQGNKRIFEMFESTGEQEAYMDKMRAQGYKVRHGASLDSLKELDGVSAKFVTDIENLMEEKLGNFSQVDAIKDEIYQMYLKSLPDLSVRKHFIHRKKVEGFAADALRAFADNTFHGSYQLARLEFADLLSEQLDEMKEGLEANPEQLEEQIKIHEKAQNLKGLERASLHSLHGDYAKKLEKNAEDETAQLDLAAVKMAMKYQDGEKVQQAEYHKLKRSLQAYKQIGGDRVKAAHLYNEMLKRHDWAMNPKGSAWANKVSSIGFTWYLGVSPAAALVNVTQTALVAYPILATKFGWSGAAEALMNSSQDYFKGGFGVEKALKGDRLKAYNEAVRSGVIDKTLAHDLAGISQEGATYNPVNNMVMEGVSFLFHNAERFNREVTYMAAYDLARSKGQTHSGAIQYAHDLTWESHFDYSSGNKARFMQNDFAKVALMFRQFSLNMTYLLARNAYNSFKGESAEVKAEARKKLTGILGMHFLFAGAMGMPLISVLGSVLEAVFDDEDEPWEFEPEFRNFLADVVGKDIGRVLSNGIANESGMNIASRVSLDGLWLRESNKELEGRDQVAYWMEQLMGPMGGILFSAGTAVDLWNEGHEWRAVESSVPKFVKDGLRGLRYIDEGAQTLRGDSLVESFEPEVIFAQMMGLSPAQLQERYEANGAIKGYERRIKDRRTNLINRFALANRLGDKDELASVKKAIIRFNAKNPQVRITRNTLIRSYKNRQRYSHDQIKGIVVDKKLRYLTENGRFAD